MFTSFEESNIKDEIEKETQEFILNEYKKGLKQINSDIFNIKERIKEYKKDLEQEEKELKKHKEDLLSGAFENKVLSIYHNQTNTHKAHKRDDMFDALSYKFNKGA